MTAAIPTEYKGVRFRSRLEATWGAFFDLLGWPWAYEPYDLRGYIPDFVLRFVGPNGPNEVLAEVKPALALVSLDEHAPKIMASGWRGDFLLLGAEPLRDDFELCIGTSGVWISKESFPDEPQEHFEYDSCNGLVGVHFFTCAYCARIIADPWKCGRCGLCGRESTFVNPHAPGRGWGEPGVKMPADEGLILSLWATAKNRVQWKGEYGA